MPDVPQISADGVCGKMLDLVFMTQHRDINASFPLQPILHPREHDNKYHSCTFDVSEISGFTSATFRLLLSCFGHLEKGIVNCCVIIEKPKKKWLLERYSTCVN